MDRIAVLIPCYNEEQTVFKVVSDFKKALPDAAIYVYNNNSSDRTVEHPPYDLALSLLVLVPDNGAGPLRLLNGSV